MLPRLFDLVCSCWFWQWEILTAGIYFFTPSTFNALWKQIHLPPVLWFLSEATESTGKHGLLWRTMWRAAVLQVCEMSQPKQCSDSKSTSSQVGVKESQVSSGVNWVAKINEDFGPNLHNFCPRSSVFFSPVKITSDFQSISSTAYLPQSS